MQIAGDNPRMAGDDSGGEDEFHWALDDFPFYDCVEDLSEPIGSGDPPSTSAGSTNPSLRDEAPSRGGSVEDLSEPIGSGDSPSTSAGSTKPSLRDDAPSRGGIRRRRFLSNNKSSSAGSIDRSRLKSSVSSENEFKFEERGARISPTIGDSASKAEDSGFSEITQSSEFQKDVVNGERLRDAENDDKRDDLAREESSLGGAGSSLLLTVAGIVVKLIGFQVNIFFNLVAFPVRSVYYLYMFVFDPFGLLRLGRQYLYLKMKGSLNVVYGIVLGSVYEWLKEHRAVWKLGLKCGWGLLWSAYVCAVMVGLLITAFVMGGILIRMVVVEPVRMTRSLNFDYAEKSPVAYVPVVINPELSHEVYNQEKGEIGKASLPRAIPAKHRLKVGVLLTLPESDYNRNLGIFQVRVDFLAADSRILASSKRPCMLQFKSQPIRLMLTFLKLAPILTGYTSETQNVKVNVKGFAEGGIPTAYLRVVIEQRAEFLPGGGIPEIYDASLTLESQLPLLRHAVWFWKKTLFVWISMTIFAMELLLALLCCTPLIIPKIKLREAANRDASQNNQRN